MTSATPTRSAEASCRRLASERVVVVHSGARDAYQVALALAEDGRLESLVTDLFWPADRSWARTFAGMLPSGVQAMMAQRSEPRVPSSRVRLCAATGLATLLLEKLGSASPAARRRMMRFADQTLGRTAGRLARTRGTGLLSYSYYGYDAFTSFGRDGILFQLHPHPASMRRILGEELVAHPDCAGSLEKEWELALPEEDFQHLVRETTMARSFLAASSFTRATLVENGASPSAVRVVPYGVDAGRFTPDSARRPSPVGKLRLLFVGRINQRKGIKYLLEALRLVGSDQVELTVCGRVVDDLRLFEPFAGQVQIRPDVSAAELVAAYQAADLFVFPSVAEGFGQVLLESLASGLPILSTTHTAAPDLIESGRQGFVVEPRRPDQIADRIEWALTHRAELAAMRVEARALAETFTWERFRLGVAEAVSDALSTSAAAPVREAGPLRRQPHAV